MDGSYGVPEIFGDEAVGPLKEIYEDIKQVLKVPIVNFIFRVLGFYEEFLNLAWQQVRFNMLTLNMEEAAEELRYPKISAKVPDIKWTKYYAESQVKKIRKVIFTFNYVNTKLLIIASAWAESLSGRLILNEIQMKDSIEPGVISGLPDIELVNVEYAQEPIKTLLLDIAKKHEAFDVASDFRAIAKFPEFLIISWKYLRPYVGRDEYNLISAGLKKRSVELAREMPFPVTISRDILESLYSKQQIAGIMGVVSMFQNLLPGLIIDGAFLEKII